MAVSVYIANEQLHVAIGSGSAKEARVKNVYNLALTEGSIINGVITNEAQLREDMMRIWRQYRLPRKELYLVIDSGKIMTKVVQVPYMKDRELINYINLEFADGERQEQVIDYFPFPKADPYAPNSVFCGAVEKSVIESYLALFESMKMKLARINIGLACLIKAAMVSGIFAGQTCIFMILEGNNAISVLFENGVYTYSRRNRLFNNPGTPERVDELEHIVDGVRRFYAQKHSEHTLDTLYITGGSEEEISRLDGRTQPGGIRAVMPGALKRIKFPQTGITDEGPAAITAASYIYSIGNLLE